MLRLVCYFLLLPGNIKVLHFIISLQYSVQSTTKLCFNMAEALGLVVSGAGVASLAIQLGNVVKQM